jgi:DNA invertase Pin-like site-specific DNA recombinase
MKKGGLQMKTVAEIAEMFGVTKPTVYNWVKDGLKHDTKKVIGKREYIIIDPDDVIEFHRLYKKDKNNE